MTPKTFVTFFSKYEDHYFWKDPGQIPFRFSRLGYKSKILTQQNKQFITTKQFIDIEYIQERKIGKKDISLLWYFLINSRKIDVLNLFHLNNMGNVFIAFLYKFFNPKGFVYLKMDNCHYSGVYNWEKIFDKKVKVSRNHKSSKPNFKKKIREYFFKKYWVKSIDLFSVEDNESKEYYEGKYDFFKNKIMVAYNGHTVDLQKEKLKVKRFTEKDDIIITVGRLGTYPKNTLNLLEGFAYSADNHNWKLYLAGPIDERFIPDRNAFFEKHKNLKNRIIFLGNLGKQELFELYNEAKVFILPSNYEGFACVYSEAMFFGNAIITTAYTSVGNLIVDKNCGILVYPEDVKNIGDGILSIILDEAKNEEMCLNSQRFANQYLTWDSIVVSINEKINDLINYDK